MFTALLDTCVLYPAYLCDTLLRLAQVGLYRPLWSGDILTELERNLVKKGCPPSAASSRIHNMRAAFPRSEVTNYEQLVDGMANDPKDRHVLAAAVRGGTSTIVTANLRDFPSSALTPYDIEARSPDDFLLDQLDLAPGLVLTALRKQVSLYRRPPRDIAALLPMLERTGARMFAAEVRRHLP